VSAKRRQPPLVNKVAAFFYKTEAGGEPVREWLKGLSKDEKKSIGEDIKTCELGGRLECLYQNLWAAAFMRYGQNFQIAASPE